jgi:3-deoxy-D-manno-octulosonic-acid transferase
MFFYNLSIRIYWLFIFSASFFNKKAKRFINGRKNIWSSLQQIKETNLYWFHCASLGEFDQGLPLMFLLKEKDPSIKILVTFFSPSGMDHYHKRKHCADYVYYLPIDTKKNARRFIHSIEPKKIFFVKYEFWLNYIFEAKSKNIPLYSISCILRPNQHFFKRRGYLFRKGLKCFELFFVQNEETKNLLDSINIRNAIITGDTRYDKVIDNKLNLVNDNTISNFLQNQKVLILGSSWNTEETIFKQALETGLIKEKVIIAPHDISEKHLNQIETLFNKNIIRYSNFSNYKNEQILLIDSIGKLANTYQYGMFAFVGGGFSGSLHNTLEPIVFGLPTVFGPKHSKFPEAAFFIQEKVALEVTNEVDFLDAYTHFKKTEKEVKKKCDFIIETSKGASQKIIDKIFI